MLMDVTLRRGILCLGKARGARARIRLFGKSVPLGLGGAVLGKKTQRMMVPKAIRNWEGIFFLIFDGIQSPPFSHVVILQIQGAKLCSACGWTVVG